MTDVPIFSRHRRPPAGVGRRLLITAVVTVFGVVSGLGCDSNRPAADRPVDIQGHWQIDRPEGRKDVGPAQMIIHREGETIRLRYWNPRTSARFAVKDLHWDGSTLMFTTEVTEGGTGSTGFWNKKILTFQGPDTLHGTWENSDGFSGEYTFRRVAASTDAEDNDPQQR